MKTETERAISLLNSSNLLNGGGTLDSSRYSLVPSFEGALKFSASKKWEHFNADVHNGIFTIEIQRRIRAETGDSKRWITILETNGKALAPALKKIRAYEWVNETRFPFESLLFDCCAELEISHIIRPIFFYPLVFPVLCAGHFPCGWDGDPVPENWDPKGPEDMPKGKLMVHLISR
jgi:hypothetical protein